MIELLQYVGTRESVRVTRYTPCQRHIYGYLLDASESLVLMHVFPDFLPDGYRILRRKDVKALRSGGYERQSDQMLAGEGLLAGLEFSADVDLSDMRSAIMSISELHGCFIIECEDDHRDVEDFYIGTYVSSPVYDRIVFRHFDAFGYWKPEPAEIDVADISQVQFGTRYAEVFRKYLHEGPRPAYLDEEDDEDDDDDDDDCYDDEYEDYDDEDGY